MSKHLIEVAPIHETGKGAGRVMAMSTIAFTLMFAVWLMFGILGVPIQKELGLTDVELSWISALAVLNGSMWRLPAGIIAEHKACREGAALFDVSHMGQAELRGEGAAAALEALTPADVQGLKPARQRYGVLMTEAGGILDDFMFTNLGDRMFLVLNASRKAVDEAAIGAILPPSITLAPMPDRALLALQGPAAERILAGLAPEVAALPFMGVAEVTLAGGPALVSRSGYTGEDGYEISVPAENATKLAEALVAAGTAPAGLGARDSLRLEAGLCLYGNDLDETTSPVEAALNWTIGKRRRTEWNFRGAERVREELDHGPKRLRVGFAVEGRQPARAHTPIQSGAEVDKFADWSDCARSDNGLYYINRYTNAMFSCRVVESYDQGSHRLFIAEITESKLFSNDETVTYDYYRSHIKPAPPKLAPAEKATWVCSVCGYVYEGETLPADFICPLCKHPASDFVKHEAKPAEKRVGFVCTVCGYVYDGADMPDDFICPLCHHPKSDFKPLT